MTESASQSVKLHDVITICPAATTKTEKAQNSPVIGAGHELLFSLGMPAARIQHRRVALKSAESDNEQTQHFELVVSRCSGPFPASPRLWLVWFRVIFHVLGAAVAGVDGNDSEQETADSLRLIHLYYLQRQLLALII